MAEKNKLVGRKIFLIDFTAETEKILVELLIRNEYEAYCLNSDYTKKIIVDFPQSIFMINNDNDQRGIPFWESFCINHNRIIRDTDSRFFFFGTQPPASGTVSAWPYIDISEGITSDLSRDIPARMDELQAKGQRQYVRFGGEDDVNVEFSFPVQDREYTGRVYDISSAGLSCAFSKETELPVNTPLPKLLLRLQGEIYTITGKTLLQRRLGTENKLFVVMFDRRMPESLRHVLQDFIHQSLQLKLETKLKQSA